MENEISAGVAAQEAESSSGHAAGKPLAVRIVEWVGWTYVALGVVTLVAVVGGFWGCWGIADPVQAAVWCLVFPVGLPLCMARALRRGSRGWFLCPHAIAVGCVTMGASARCLSAAIAGAVLLLVPFVLLFTPAASRWFNWRSAARKGGKWTISAGFPIVLLMVALFLSMAGGGVPSTAAKRFGWAAESVKVLHRALAKNDELRKAGLPWADPSSHEDSLEFLLELSRVVPSEEVTHASVVAPWCIAVDPPDDGRFPVVFTANVNPADLLRPERDRRPAALACPRCRGHLATLNGYGPPRKVCDSFCDRAALAAARNGEVEIMRSFTAAPSMFSPERVQQGATVRFLTPTGRVDVVVRK